MNRLFFLAAACSSFFGYAQVSFGSWTNGYMQINSYNGTTNADAITMTLSGNGTINMPHWRIAAKVLQPITSANGQHVIPANKISVQPISSTGQAHPNPIPTISEIGAPLNVFLQQSTDVFLIPQSNVPLYNAPAQPNGYYNLQLKYAMTLNGGAYLGSFPAWTDFYAPIELTAYDRYNTVIGRMTHTFRFQIGNITDAPAPAVLSLTVTMGASNGVLEFNSMQDYSNGVSVTYPNGLEARSSTAFQIKVKAQGDLRSAIGNVVPIGAVHLALLPAAGASQSSGPPVALSLTNQILATGSHTNGGAYRYDVKYYTLAQDERLVNAKPDHYAATLLYEITPQ
ncbi:hypothetical protein [Flavobacterium macacae]|uniref:Uncharacterized protein n=1 Tax=Flavobacterium macacae TaxID=2488993 RepID=A0A3P3WEM2_9FLAO|nr:hypothetical protein [Flavobacterium macacae]RRJ93581.1 hypothetical protein EG849_01745 [Flavobacterium macacae]